VPSIGDCVEARPELLSPLRHAVQLGKLAGQVHRIVRQERREEGIVLLGDVGCEGGG
jgi:hypothetical protein